MAAPGSAYRTPALPPLVALAVRQGGAVGRAQLLELGFSKSAIQRQLAVGRLHPVHRAVYAVGHPTLTPLARRHAALLAVGPDAGLSYRTAAALWEIRHSSRARIEVTTTRRGRRSFSFVEIHGVRTLHPDEITTHQGLRVTTVARTLLDLADVLPPHQLEHALEESVRRRLFDLHAVRAVIERAVGRRGVRKLTCALELLHDAPPLTRSDSNAPSPASTATAPFPLPGRTSTCTGGRSTPSGPARTWWSSSTDSACTRRRRRSSGTAARAGSSPRVAST